MRKLVTIIGAALFVMAWLNFTVFWFVAVYLGGDAISGRIENGHYYLSSHGRLTEVTPSVWRYSRAHTMSTWITHPLGFLGFGLMALGQWRKKAA